MKTIPILLAALFLWVPAGARAADDPTKDGLPILEQQWGFYEPAHWRPRAALFRKDWSPKPNGRAFLDLVFKQWWIDDIGVTGADGRYAARAFHGDYEVTVKKAEATKREHFPLSEGERSVRKIFTATGVLPGRNTAVMILPLHPSKM